MEEEKFVWSIDNDLILFVESDAHFSSETNVSGHFYDDDLVVLDTNRVSHPINVEYFVRLWNAQFPEKKISKDSVVFEDDGEHRKLAMPPRGIPAGKSLQRVGDFGESLVYKIPGMKVIESLQLSKGLMGSDDVDLGVIWNGIKYGVEVKANQRTGVDPYRYRLTGYGDKTLAQVRAAKTKYAISRGYNPATLGITIDFENQTFDACLLPFKINSFLGGARTVIAKDIPFDADDLLNVPAPKMFDQKMPPRIPNHFMRPGELTKPMPQVADDSDLDRIFSKTANILDPIHDELDQRVFDGIEPRHNFFDDHLYHIRQVFRQYGYDPDAFSFYLTGSICTYQYSDTSDCDITIICDADEFEEEDRADLVGIVISELDGSHFPGTPYPYQHFVQPFGIDVFDLFRTGLKSAYDFQDNSWVVPPDKSRARNVMSEYPDWFAKAIQASDKLNLLIDQSQIESAWEYWHEIHNKRKEDMTNGGGDFSEGNIIYKYLVNNGTVDRLRIRGYAIST